MVSRGDLVSVSSLVWWFLDECDASGFSPREETVTENLVLALARMAHSKVWKSTVGDEKRHGYDLRWAVRVPGGQCYDLVIQAKKLARANKSRHGYEDLSQNMRKCAEARQQSVNLITYAALLAAQARPGEPTPQPFHMLYNGTHAPWQAPGAVPMVCRLFRIRGVVGV